MTERIPKATHTGTLKVGDIAFDVAVLDDADHTRIVTEANFMEAMGMYRSGALSTRRPREEGQGAQIPLSLAYKNLKPYVEQHLDSVHFKPVKYVTTKGRISRGGLPASIIPKI